MNILTAKELEHMNNLTALMKVGDKVQEIIQQAKLVSLGAAPVNAVAAKETLTLTGVVVDGETVSINSFDPAVLMTDVYEFVADAAKSVSAAGYIPVDIAASTTASTNNLTIATQPTSGDTMTIGTKVYTFVPAGTANADGEISIGTSLATAKTAILEAINGTDDHNEPHPLVSLGAFNVNVAPVTALVGGTAGDTIATTETFTAVGNVFSAVTLGAGADCSAANAITALVAAITASDTQGVSAEDGAGDTVVITAKVKGVSGNGYEIAETLANGAFTGGAIKLSGGVNGTPGFAHEYRSDASYLYVCTADNTIADANWRRISLGSVY